MFADPQSVTINAVATPLPRVSVGDRVASYTNGDNTLSLTISHLASSKGRTRRMVRVDNRKVAADPFLSGANREVTMSAYLVIDEPSDDAYSNTEVLNNVKGLIGWSTDANLTKVIAGES